MQHPGSKISAFFRDSFDRALARRVSSYVYDDAGDRVAETTGPSTGSGSTVTTKYLTDTANPTGYDQPLEETTGGASTPTRTYLIGDRVFGHANSSDTVSYLLPDGHGSTQAITNAS